MPRASNLLRFIYSVLFYIAIPFVLLRLLWRSRREPLYRATMGQRFGFVPGLRAPRPVWIHAVSAGETNAAAPLVERLLGKGYSVLVTTMTPTGRERVNALFGDRVVHYYAPYDLPGAMMRFLARARPSTLAIVDTEIWPNMIHYAHRNGTRTLLINARLSEKSARGYRLVAPLVRNTLRALDAVAVQTETHAARFRELGMPADRLSIAGSIKFDVTLPSDLAERTALLRQKAGNRRIVLAASTHPGEEEIALDAFVAMGDAEPLLVLAPRHPHRAEEVEKLCNDRGFDVIRHSANLRCEPGARILLLDTMGELMYFYKIADVAFVGGSLVPVGGHNPMEPASLSVPVIMGPYLHNIEEIAAQFVEAGGMLVVDGAAALGRAFAMLLNNEPKRRELVKNAMRVMDANRGALDRVLALMESPQ